MKRPFQPGDRVAVYGGICNVDSDQDRKLGTVRGFETGHGTIRVEFDRGFTGAQGLTGRDWCVHAKQCRRLVKRERRRAWFKFNESGTFNECTIHKPAYPQDWIEFIEVRTKKETP